MSAKQGKEISSAGLEPEGTRHFDSSFDPLIIFLFIVNVCTHILSMISNNFTTIGHNCPNFKNLLPFYIVPNK